jgi:hypothetical protein
MPDAAASGISSLLDFGLPSRSSPRWHNKGQKMSLRQLTDDGATVYAHLYDASEDWRQGDYAPTRASDSVARLLNSCLQF